MRPLVIGNWKMNGGPESWQALANAVVSGVKEENSPVGEAASVSANVVLCPPFPGLSLVAACCAHSPVLVGAQDVSPYEKGAYTGDISAAMLAETGCRYVLAGHSERRSKHGESNETVNAKARAVQQAGMTAVVCIGESESEKESGATLRVLDDMVRKGVKGLGYEGLVVAYEPVWAIGSGKVPEKAELAETFAYLAEKLPGVPLLYGGSVTGENAAEIAGVEHIAGALVGGASLKPESFRAVIKGFEKRV